MEYYRDVFFSIIRAGLWADIESTDFGIQGFTESVDWDKVYQLATEQSVIGIALAGIEQLKKSNLNLNVPQEILLQWIGDVQLMEQQNRAMNDFIAELVAKMRKSNIYTLLVKGQGIAQCYESPLLRASGDIDLFLSNENYLKAKSILMPMASSIDEENRDTKHLSMIIDSWEVELHGTLRSELWGDIEKVLDEVQYDVFCGGNVRSWMNGKTQIFLPGENEDVVYVFTHILHHFFKGGVGLRQICDWCRILWTYRNTLDRKKLENRICAMGIMTEWRVFSVIAVEWLGMPKEAMPFYNPKHKWQRKAKRVIDFILESGNFGHNRDTTYRQEKSDIKRKYKTFQHITADSIRLFMVSPFDAMQAWWCQMRGGIETLLERVKSRIVYKNRRKW